ncbi:MAG: DUF4238 domain-containing protein [Hyphomicrobiaceae bacterium]|nr:DUF4238 domain-containing protein [Hyphomicrobiaceae bacterium]
MSQKKKHHYVPISYLKAFCAEDSKLTVYRKDDPTNPYRTGPDDVGFHKYYYAQPLQGGGRDTNCLEDRFSELETKWPPIVNAMSRRSPVNDRLEDIFAFVGLQRARVPAARDSAERMLAERVLHTTRQLARDGKLPPPPKGMEDLLEHVEVSIDPHQSIHAMRHIIRGMGQVLDRIGIVVLHNQTDAEFVTSDNPVAYFDPGVSNEKLRPYTLDSSGPAVVMMPISPRLMLYGTSWDKERFARRGLDYRPIDNVATVAALNEKVVRFAYAAIYASGRPDKELIKRYAASSPVLKATPVALAHGQGLHLQFEFGKRVRLPKWKAKNQQG